MKLVNRSSKASKVRKSGAASPVREKSLQLLKASFSDDLKSKYGRNSFRVRPGDSVKLTRGEFSGVEGKVQKVFPTQGRITVEGVTREKIKGGTTPIRIHSSNFIITSLNLDDKLRKKKLEGTT
jgi:large subunit ribosomal protein L24